MRTVRVLLAVLVALLLVATDTFVVTTDAAAARRCRLGVATAVPVDGVAGTGVVPFKLLGRGAVSRRVATA